MPEVLNNSIKTGLEFGFGFRQSVCAITVFPASLFFEGLDAFEPFKYVALRADFGCAFQAAVHGHNSILRQLFKNDRGS